MNVIAFSGVTGSGKDTCATELISVLKQIGITPVQVNFGDLLKQAAMIIYGLSYDECYNPDIKNVELTRWPFKSPRFLMQELATEMIRDRYPDTWIEGWKRKVDSLNPSFVNTVILTDLRFPNEAEMLKQRNAFFIRMERPDNPFADSNIIKHASESNYDQIPFDLKITNNGGVNDLRNHMIALSYRLYQHNNFDVV